MTLPERAPAADSDIPRVEYRAVSPDETFPEDVLAAITFGNARHRADARCVRVGLEPLRGESLVEIWHASGPITAGFDGEVRWTSDGQYLLAAVEIDERRHPSVEAASRAAYAALWSFQSRSAYSHLLRVWNYFDDINEGDGDSERYKRFCVGRAAAYNPPAGNDHPAATAIGRRSGDAGLQVYWLAGRKAGLPLENPRQMSAYRYPRQYGPVSPSFSRAMLVAGKLLLISGTASIVGHVSHHPGDLRAQINESLNNLDSLLHKAAGVSPAVGTRLGANSLLKIYLKDAQALDEAEAEFRKRLPPEVPYIVLEADVCRRELLVEIDCIHRA